MVEFVSVAEAAAALGVQRSRGYELVASGVIPSIRAGRRLLVPRRGIDALIDDAVRRAIALQARW